MEPCLPLEIWALRPQCLQLYKTERQWISERYDIGSQGPAGTPGPSGFMVTRRQYRQYNQRVKKFIEDRAAADVWYGIAWNNERMKCVTLERLLLTRL